MKENDFENYVMMNPYIFSLLNPNEFIVFAEIIRLCNINSNFASLKYFKERLNISINTIRKAINQLVILKLISKHQDYNVGCCCYNLNLNVIADVYKKLNSFNSIEERQLYCEQYVESCINKANAISQQLTNND